jgi:hypothetical protein
MLMVEDENEGKRRTELLIQKQKWTVAANSLTELVRQYTMENPMEYDQEDYPMDMDYDHHSTPRESATPSASNTLSDRPGLVMGRPSPAL